MIRRFVQRVIDEIASASGKERFFMDKMNFFIDKMNLTPEEIQALADAIKVAKHHVDLHLDYNNVGDDGAKALAEAIKEANHPVTLDLRKNNIGDEGAKALAGAIAVASVLVKLDLSNNNIESEGAKALAEAITKVSVYVTLDLRGNNIGYKGAKALAEVIKKANHPITLDLGFNSIRDEGAKALAEAIAGASVSVTLNLEWNNIGDEGASALADVIKEAKHSVKLYLSENNIGDDGARALAEAIAGASVPVRLDFSERDMEEGAEALKVALRINKIRCEYPVHAIKEFLSTVPCENRRVLCGAIANYKVPEITEEKINKYLGGYAPSVSKEQASKILARTLFCTAEGPFAEIPPEIREVLLSKIEDGYLEDLVMEVYKEIKDANPNATAVGKSSGGEGNTEVSTTDDNSGGGAEKNSDGEESNSLSADSSAEAQEYSNATNTFYAYSPKELILRLVDTVEELFGKEAKEYEESIQELESEEGLANITFSQFLELDIPEKYVDTQHVLGGMVSVGSHFA